MYTYHKTPQRRSYLNTLKQEELSRLPAAQVAPPVSQAALNIQAEEEVARAQLRKAAADEAELALHKKTATTKKRIATSIQTLAEKLEKQRKRLLELTGSPLYTKEVTKTIKNNGRRAILSKLG